MKIYVIDASVILKVFLNESTSVIDEFSTILKKTQEKKVTLLSSKMLNIEVANGLRFSVKDQVEAIKTFKDFMSLPIKTFVITKLQNEKTIKLSYELGTTVYDTSYHVLAKAHNAIFLTCDEKYYEKAKDLGDIELIK